MKTVRATALGYYNDELKFEGVTFDVPDDETASWFEPVEKTNYTPPVSGPRKRNQGTDDSML